jgi:glycosyltransferase involved in cell wall biosynthesis
MNWLIVEDALRDRKGHWFEYVSTFRQGLKELGDEVTVLADREAEAFVREGLQSLPILPSSIWHRMSDGAGRLARYARVPVHAWQTIRAMRRYFATSPEHDVIFVPTVLVHHLLGWTWLIKRHLRHGKTRIILFFPNAPIGCNLQSGATDWMPSPTTQLFRRLLRWLAPEVKGGRVILGAETHPMRQALSSLSGVPFTYFPHPVTPVTSVRADRVLPGETVMGSYGGARYEKGNDILYRGIAEFSGRYPDPRVRFVLQCVEGFIEERRPLENNARVTWLTRYFGDGEYPKQLAHTHVMLLPYRLSSYRLRVSRVAVEAMVNGIPIVVTRGTTLADQAAEFGAAIQCEDGNPHSVGEAIFEAERNYGTLAAKARATAARAQAHFSVKHFRDCVSSVSSSGSCG